MESSDDSQNERLVNFGLGAGFAIYISWVIATTIGVVAGSLIPHIEKWGLDFAMPVAFLGMTIVGTKNTPAVAAAVAAAIFSLVFFSVPYKLGLLVAVLLGVTCGVIVKKIIALRKQGINVDE